MFEIGRKELARAGLCKMQCENSEQGTLARIKGKSLAIHLRVDQSRLEGTTTK